MGYLKVGKYSSYNIDAVQYKTLDELYEMFSLKPKASVKALHDELRKLGLTKKPKAAKKEVD